MKHSFFKKITMIMFAAMLCVFCFGCGPGTQDPSASFDYEKADLDAPLRGIALWNTSSAQPVPYALEYLPIPLNQVVTANGGYDFSYSDNRLNTIASRGNHTVLRFVLWEPPAAYLPQTYLDAGVNTVSSEGVLVPDFSDDVLLDKLCEFIAAAGAHYDGDGRIGFLQLGLMGRWGEWNYSSDYPAGKIPSAAQYNRIYAAFDAAFDMTQLQARNPNIGSPKNYAIGYHDDNFMFSTLGNGGGDFKYLCEQGGIAADLWKTQSFGAELSGHEAGDFFSTEEKRTRFTQSVRYQNFSFMMWQRYDTVLGANLWQTHRDAALELTRTLGYEFYVKRAWATRETKNTVNVTAEIQNTGNAPFYYDWSGMAEFYSGDILVKSQSEAWSLSSVMPGETKSFTMDIPLADHVTYDAVYLSIVNPLSQFSQNAKVFRFANKTGDLTDGKLKLRV